MKAQTVATAICVKAREKRTVVIDHPGEYVIELIGEGADVTVTGNFSVKDNERVTVKLVIRHLARHTTARTILKGVVWDNGSLDLLGKIIIEKNCAGTQSFLTERVLLMSEGARSQAVPELEILTDDVKCSHAASISRPASAQVFYLQSRGLSIKQAQTLIADGFLSN